jgi:hypothetical protein
MQSVEFGEGLMVGHTIAVGKRLGRRAAAIAQVALGTKLFQQPLHLGRRIAGNFDEETQQQPTLAPAAPRVAKAAQDALDPGAARAPIRGAKLDVGGAFKELLDLLEAAQLVGIESHDHPRRMT